MVLPTESKSVLRYFSDFLSIITIAICFVSKVPQILKLLNVKSARGINLLGLLMELTSGKNNILQCLSTGLSIIVISICLVVKIPQIFKILKVNSAQGINLVSLLLDLTGYTIMMSYNYRNSYALLSYLEYPIILVQELVLIFFVLKYKNYLNVYSLFGSGVYFSVAAGLLLEIAPLGLLTFLVPLCTPIGASSKVVQLVEILRTKNAQSVSILTWFISAFTNFTRVFTITLESGDLTLLLNFTINTFLSSSVMLAAIYYKNPDLTSISKARESTKSK